MIFLLKKNVRTDIIKIILGYLPIAVLETLQEWKVTIILVKQGYESIESWHDYKMGIEITYKERGIQIDIRKSKDNFDKNNKLRYFNCNIYKYIAKECQIPKR